MKALRIICALLLIAGACLSGRALYMHAKAELAGILVRRAWEQSVQSGKPQAPWPWADTHPVARIRIPRLGYDEIVLEGASPRTLAFGPAHLLNGTALGEPGNLVLAGHRTSWFRPLENIAQGDTIQIQWFDAHRGGLHERTYTVNRISVVEPQDTALLASTRRRRAYPDHLLSFRTRSAFSATIHRARVASRPRPDCAESDRSLQSLTIDALTRHKHSRPDPRLSVLIRGKVLH